jgi:hypothetical protein
MNLATSVATFFNIFVNPIALDSIQWKYYLVYVGLLFIITLTIYFCYPETRGHSLEEMSRLFDGDEAVVHSEGTMSAKDKGSVSVSEHV